MNTIAVDFDGTLAEGEDIEMGKPLPGAIDFLTDLYENGFSIVIFSRRDPGQISQWMSAYVSWVSVQITDRKPSAFAYLDNHAIRFEGEYPSMDDLKELAGE
jgi:hypothetical protein